MNLSVLLITAPCFLLCCNGPTEKAVYEVGRPLKILVKDIEEAGAITIEQKGGNSSIIENDCRKYWKRRDSLNSIKYNFFQTNVLVPALNNKQLPDANRRFLLALKEYLTTDRKSRSSNYIIDQPMLSLFTIKENLTGITGNPYYEKTLEGKFADISREHALLKRSEKFRVDKLTISDTLAFYREMFDSAFSSYDKGIFIFTDQKRVHSSIYNLGFYFGECTEFYHYSVSTSSLNSSDMPIFASRFPLELVYEDFPEIASLIKNEYALGVRCYDCSPKFEPEKAFAQLVGVEHLYFTYTDSFPINNQFYYPERALVMKIDGQTKTDLWVEEIDWFGCPCL